MNKIIKLAALLSACLMAFAGCAPEELSTDQFSDDSVTFAAFAPNPVARGGALRITGSNLQKVTEVVIPGIDPITDIEVVAEGRKSEIRVIVPVNGPEVGPVSIVADGQTYTSLVDLTYSEPIILEGFSPASAMPGDEITINGDYINNIKAVQFEGGATVTEFVAQDRYEMKVIVPANAVTGKLILCDVDENNNPDGLVANLFYTETELTIGDPTVNSADRGNLKIADEVVVKGEYLNMIESANFGGVNADFAINEEATELTVALPATAVDGDLALVSFAGKEFKAGAYTTVVPTDLAIEADSRYKAGFNATITGNDLDLVTGAALAGTALEYTFEDDVITFTIPATAVDGAVTLTLANGKTVDTEAVELVKPVVTEVTPLELMAGETITVKGDDLDLVVSATLGGKDVELAYVDEALTLTTNNTSSSGKIVLSLANGVTVEPSEEIRLSYDSFIVVNEMPAAEHIGATVTLKGSNFMMIENIFIGDVKVEQYVSRTDDQISFIMPWNKVGTYSMKFQLLSGEEEICPTSIEVLLELITTVAWEGNCPIDWSANKVFVPAKYFEGVSAGTKMRVYYTQKDQVWAQAQFNNGAWQTINFNGEGGVKFDGNLVPTDIHGWFEDGILDRCDEIVLTAEILDNIRTNAAIQDAGPEAGVSYGLIIQGSDLTFTKIEILQEIAQEKTIWEGSFNNAGWAGNQDLAWGGFDWTTVTAGQTMTIYGAPNDPAAGWCCVSLRVGDGWGNLNGVPAQYDNPGEKLSVVLTQESLDHLISGQGLVVTGDGYTMTKITLL